tara:strand:+ start:69866 stop:70390 length:525 start_codon:yes stop_codon:yes gene_type:complete
MENLLLNNEQLIPAIEIFIMMLGAFLIGYLFGKRKNKTVKEARPKLKEEKTTQKTNDIETIFTELKPEIIKIIEKHNHSSFEKEEKKEPLTLNFENFGHAKEIDKDDLTKIEGIGPFVEEKLNNLGIYTYDQISRFQANDIKALTHLLEYFPGRIERDEWVGKAKMLLNKKATR